MTLERIEHKVFASEAPLEEMGQFGSALATTKLNTKDVTEIQALPAYTKGWGSAIISENNYPPMEEMNGVLNVMSYHTGYLYQEGIPTYSATQEYSVTSWVKDLAGEKVYKSLQGGNKGHDLTDPAWWMELKLGGSSFNLFDTKISDHILDGEEAKGWALQGTYVSGALYPDFYAKCLEEYNEATETETVNGVTVKVNANGHKFYNIADKTTIDEFFNTIGSAWFYGIDTENERVFLPRNNWFEQTTADVSEVGNFVEAGLPNITGTIGTNGGGFNRGSGCLTTAGGTTQFAHGAIGGTWGFSLDASRSSVVYGKSDTVQPNAVKKLLYICVGNTVINESQIDAGGLVAQMEQKANIFLDNILPSQSFKTQITSWIIPDYSAGIVPTSGFVCPADGLIHIISAYSSGSIWVKVNGVQIYQYASGGAWLNIDFQFNVSKGDVITFALPTLKYEFDVIHFYPLKGAN